MGFEHLGPEIEIRVRIADENGRQGLAAVQHIGKTLIVWREKRAEEVSAGSVTERPKKAVSKAKSAKALSARRGIASLTAKAPRKTHWFATPNKSRRNPAD